MDLSPAATMNLRSGEIIHIEQYIWVGDRADVSAVTDLLLRHEPQLKGDLNQAGAIIHVNRADGTAVTQTSTGADGRFSLHLQAGEYRLRMVASGGLSREMAVSVETGGTDLGSLSIGAVAEIQLPRNYPMRLVFKGEKGTLDPNFADDLLGFQLTRGDRVQHRRSSPDVNLAGIAADPQSIPLPLGNYRVYATRGPEFGVTEAVIEVHEAGRYVLEISPPLRVLETPGWISADLHVHAEASFDTNFPVRERLRSFVAQGGEVLVSTEHDVIYDFSTDITQLGVGHLMRSIVGVEITSEVMSEAAPYTIGHGNAFPMKRIEHAFRKGAPISENRRWRDLIAELRALDTDPVLQLNHARYGASEDSAANPQAFFTHLGSSGRSFDPNIPLSEGVNRILNEKDPTNGLRDIDFSALELLNGNNMAAYRQLRSDWFSLLKQGERLTATANSDSHGAGSIVAVPRTMVRFDGELKDFRETDFIKAIKGGRVYATTGPLLDVTLGDAEIGGMVTGEQAVLKVAVKAASWVPVSTLKVYVNGQVAVQRDIRNGESLALPLSFSRDSFVTVEVEGNPSPLYTTLLPGFVPLAFTNPIYIDADGDGTWTAPMQ